MRPLFSFFKYFLALAAPFILSIAFAQTAEEKINSATKSYQDGHFDEAKNSLTQAVEQNKSDSSALYNLGLAEYKLGNVGHALGYWYKALSINPGFKEAKQAIDFANSKLQPSPEKPEIDGVIDAARYKILPYFPYHLLQIVTLITLFIFWRRFLREFKARKIAEKDQIPKPAFSLTTFAALILLLIFSTLDVLKVYELSLQRAVIVEKKTDAKTGPGENQVTLFELSEGTEVIIKESQNDWYKVSTPSDKLGWVQKKSIYLTTD